MSFVLIMLVSVRPAYCQTTLYDSNRIAKVCQELKLEPLIEDSGHKGQHIWFCFSQPVAAKLVRRFLQFILTKAGEPGAEVH